MLIRYDICAIRNTYNRKAYSEKMVIHIHLQEKILKLLSPTYFNYGMTHVKKNIITSTYTNSIDD